MKFLKIAALPLIAVACMAATPVYAADKSEAKANKKVCKKFRPTGTRIAKKTCMSQRGWDEVKKKAQDAARTSQRLSGHQNRDGG